MKTLQHLAQYVLIALAMGATAQQGINYKALIKDGGGNIVTNQNITIQFQILQGAGMVNVYQETHNPMTDANGIVIVNIGEGNTTDDFSAIDWGSDDHYLNVQIDTGGGLTDLGTTQFMAVPYAFQAIKASNVTGLEALNEGNGIGWRLIGRDPTKYGIIGSDAKDFSFSYIASSSLGATGGYSTALGTMTSASGIQSLTTGFSTTASGENSVATGSYTLASGNNSTAMGTITKAESFASTAIGRYNVGGGSPDTWVNLDPLFEIGNGTDDLNRSNVFTVLKNGIITAPELTISNIDTAIDRVLITREYADTNYIPTGLEALDEGNGTGWRLIGRDPANYGDIGQNAMDLSYSNAPSSTKGATGENAFATGFNTVASEFYSTALGNNTTASGYWSTAMGHGTTASAFYSTALGVETKAESWSSTVLGVYNIGGGSPVTRIETDPLFEIGNGINDGNRSNALTVLKNGTIMAPEFSVSEIETAGNPALITKEYADTNYLSTGLQALDEGNGIGWRLINRNASNYGDLGLGAIDFSYSSVASTIFGATGDHAIAMGSGTIASGPNSTSIGANTVASGNFSIGMGYQTTASNFASIAMGAFTLASAPYSTAIGYYTNAESYISATIGRFNQGGGSVDTWIATDPLFEIGNGTSDVSRSNAMTVLKNGKVGIGTNAPNTLLQITGGGDANLGNTSGYMVIGNVNASNIVMDDNELMARNNGAAADLLLQWSGGDLYIGNSSATVYVNNVLTHSSDARLKQDITNLNYGLEEILKLRPVSYRWKSNPNVKVKTIGLIAQEVKPLVNELVGVNKQRDNTLTLNYEGLIPVLINAIQEQQEIITSQKEELNSLKLDFNTRLKQIEETLNTQQQ